jgi:hypothetical protein
MMAVDPTDELPHPGAAVDEWVFAAWAHDGTFGVVSGHRLLAGRAWYWSALVRAGRPLLHLAEWEVRVRPDPFVVKAPEMWAEHHCDAPLEQWSIGNEAYFTALDDPSEALGRGYGVPTPTAIDLEWYAVGEPGSWLRAGGRGARCDRGCGRADHPARRGAGAALAAVEPAALARTRRSDDGGRAHRAAGSVRVPRRCRGRLGGQPVGVVTSSGSLTSC